MTASKERPLTDSELIAVAALAQVYALSMTATNAERVALGQALAYDDCYSDASARLETELRRRGAL